VLDVWAQWIRRALAAGREVYAYFNNDVNGYAVYDAERLRLRVEGRHALGDREPMQKPDPQQQAAAYPAYPTRHGRRVAPRRRPRMSSTTGVSNSLMMKESD
jgi:hypothetical protein